MKIIHVTDTHLAPVGTRYRQDNYEDAIFAKLSQVAAAARELEALVIHTGDVFDLQNPQGVPRELIYRFSEFIAESGVGWVLLAGQHDFRGRDPSGGRYSPLGLLKHHRNVVFSDPTLPVARFCFSWGSLICVQYHNGIMGTLQRLGEAIDERVSIIAVHAMLTDMPVPWDHLLLDDLTDLPAQMVLSGDYHAGFAFTTREGPAGPIHFCNPGGLGRVDRNEAERTPQYAIVDPLEGTATYVKVNASPGAEAFDLIKAEDDVAKTNTRSAFAERIGSLDIGLEMSFDRLVQQLPKEDERIVERAREFYQQASVPS